MHLADGLEAAVVRIAQRRLVFLGVRTLMLLEILASLEGFIAFLENEKRERSVRGLWQ